VTSFNAPPDARVLWCLRRTSSDVICLLRKGANAVEVQVLQDRDIVLTQHFQEEGPALRWAATYQRQLKDRGWGDSPVTKAS
jgi:hypothetical protein